VLLDWPPPDHLWIGRNRGNSRHRSDSTNARASMPAGHPGITPELRFPHPAAQTRIGSVARIRLDSRKSVRPFKGIICDAISEFESYMASQTVRSPPARVQDSQLDPRIDRSAESAHCSLRPAASYDGSASNGQLKPRLSRGFFAGAPKRAPRRCASDFTTRPLQGPRGLGSEAAAGLAAPPPKKQRVSLRAMLPPMALSAATSSRSRARPSSKINSLFSVLRERLAFLQVRLLHAYILTTGTSACC
jgi:hypothetical protein